MPPAAFGAVQALTTLQKTALGQGARVQRAYALLTSQLAVVFVTMATAQVMLGLSLVGSLLTRKREIGKTFAYWNVILRGLYHCPDSTMLRYKAPLPSGQAHKLAWRSLAEKIGPIFTYVPALGRAKDAAAHWFIST